MATPEEKAKEVMDKAGAFERHPKVNDVLSNVGDKLDVVFKDNGKLIEANVIANVLKEKKIKGVQARDSMIFVVLDEKSKSNMEMWLSASSWSNLAQLRAIRDKNNGTLVGARVKIERVEKENPDKASFDFKEI